MTTKEFIDASIQATSELGYADAILDVKAMVEEVYKSGIMFTPRDGYDCIIGKLDSMLEASK